MRSADSRPQTNTDKVKALWRGPWRARAVVARTTARTLNVPLATEKPVGEARAAKRMLNLLHLHHACPCSLQDNGRGSPLRQVSRQCVKFVYVFEMFPVFAIQFHLDAKLPIFQHE